MRALAVIEAEHRNMLRVANALGILAERLSTAPTGEDLHTVALIADYFHAFPERFHHPKESELLFAQIRRRSNESGEILDRLDREHQTAPAQVTRIHGLAATTPATDRARIADLIDGDRVLLRVPFRAHARRRGGRFPAGATRAHGQGLGEDRRRLRGACRSARRSRRRRRHRAAARAHHPASSGARGRRRPFRDGRAAPAPTRPRGRRNAARGQRADVPLRPHRGAARRRPEGRRRRAGRAGGRQRRRQDHAAALHFRRSAPPPPARSASPAKTSRGREATRACAWGSRKRRKAGRSSRRCRSRTT